MGMYDNALKRMREAAKNPITVDTPEEVELSQGIKGGFGNEQDIAAAIHMYDQAKEKHPEWDNQKMVNYLSMYGGKNVRAGIENAQQKYQKSDINDIYYHLTNSFLYGTKPSTATGTEELNLNTSITPDIQLSSTTPVVKPSKKISTLSVTKPVLTQEELPMQRTYGPMPSNNNLAYNSALVNESTFNYGSMNTIADQNGTTLRYPLKQLNVQLQDGGNINYFRIFKQ